MFILKYIVCVAMPTKKVFIVEDDNLNLMLFSDLLIFNGYEVSSTLNGFESLDKIIQFMPDMIVINIQLKGVSGFDIIKRLKKDIRLCNIPVIAVTSCSTKDFKNKIFNCGFASYITKPMSINSFLDIVKSVDDGIAESKDSRELEHAV